MVNTPIEGRAGVDDPEARSDLFVTARIPGGGGRTVQLRSKVQAMYGPRIRAEIDVVLYDLRVDNAEVIVEDRGALPFVVKARVEAAVRAALGWPVQPAEGAVSSPSKNAAEGAPTISPRDRRRRSRLYLPGNAPKYMVNAGLHGPDAVILDLEDSVHPDHKSAARVLVRRALQSVDFMGAERMVRINQGEAGLADLAELLPGRPDLILIPKVESSRDVQMVSAFLDEHDAANVLLMPIIESALGVEAAFEIAQASPRNAALTIGLEDYTADLGVPKTLEGRESLFARMRVVNAARAAGLQAIDSVFGDVGDMEGLAAWARASRALGFEGMGCIHPRQIPVIHRAFAPTEAELEKAQRIVAAFEEAEQEGRSVVSLGSRMIDPPVVLRARKLVERAAITEEVQP